MEEAESIIQNAIAAGRAGAATADIVGEETAATIRAARAQKKEVRGWIFHNGGKSYPESATTNGSGCGFWLTRNWIKKYPSVSGNSHSDCRMRLLRIYCDLDEDGVDSIVYTAVMDIDVVQIVIGVGLFFCP